MSSSAAPKVVPAQLSFLAIYNPSLADSDETFHQQIVFYYAKAAKARAKLGHGDSQAAQHLREAENEKLRQVGLAQGMVGFARSFSSGEPVDSIETDKSRIVLHELERGWWILASIDLTQLPATSPSTTTNTTTTAPAVEYSAREVSPPALLIQQMVRAHDVFTLHHGWPLDQLFKKHGRDKFCNIMATYWSRFSATWDVLLHGSPAVDMFPGLKLAAGGELGMGVGEEEWGSSERDVLEDFARRTEGLVDVIVSRFGEASPRQTTKPKPHPSTHDDEPAEPWIGCGGHVAATDGVVFSGVGGLSRSSLRDIAYWTEDMYHYGDHAYGIRDNPTSDRRRRRRRNLNPTTRQADSPAKPSSEDKSQPHDSGTGEAPRIPPPIVKAVESSLDKASKAIDDAEGRAEPAAKQETGHMLASLGDTETWMKYMTLGYGTAWGGKKLAPEPSSGPIPAPTSANTSAPTSAPTSSPDATTRREQSPEAMRYVEPAPDVDWVEEKRKAQVQSENNGYFLVGLKGNMVEADMDDDNDEGNWNARIPLRTVYVEKVSKGTSISESDETPGEDSSKEPSFNTATKLERSRLRPVVYVHRPFIYTFVFAQRTSALSIASFYRDIHHFFAPLHRSLDRNTTPARVADRLAAALTHQTTSSPNTSPIYDLVWDPRTLTVHSSIPSIPDPGTLIAEGLGSNSSGASKSSEAWTRLDALNVHAHILATVHSTRRSNSEIERTCKTARGWWVVWMRLPPSSTYGNGDVDADTSTNPPSNLDAAADAETTTSTPFTTSTLRQAFLIRCARDTTSPAPQSASGRIAGGVWSGVTLGLGGARPGSSASQSQRMGGAAAGWGPRGLVEGIGIGVDARKYVDELLSLNR